MTDHITQEQRQKALRIYREALPLIAAAIGVPQRALHNRVLRAVLFKDLMTFKPGPLVSSDEPEGGDDDPPGAVGVVADPLHNSDQPEGAENEVQPAQHSEPEIPASALSDELCAPEGNSEPENIPRIIPEAPPMLQLKPRSSASFDEHTQAATVTLRNTRTGMWLHFSGTKLTEERGYAYRGTLAQAKKMRASSDVARGLSITNFNPKGSS